jgi:putative endonuclease
MAELGDGHGLMSRTPTYYVYVMANHSKTLYIGVTNDLHRRTYEHQHRLLGGFTARYKMGQLVYFEAFEHISDAIAREKQLKGWSRSKKISLIEARNPGWLDLS